VEFTRFLIGPGVTAAMGMEIQKDFGKKQRGKSLMSLKGSQQPSSKLLNIICRFLVCIFDLTSFLP